MAARGRALRRAGGRRRRERTILERHRRVLGVDRVERPLVPDLALAARSPRCCQAEGAEREGAIERRLRWRVRAAHLIREILLPLYGISPISGALDARTALKKPQYTRLPGAVKARDRSAPSRKKQDGVSRSSLRALGAF